MQASRLGLPFWYRLTRVVPEKGPLNGHVCVCVLIGLRYAYVQVSIETHVLDVIREQLSRRQPVDGGSRNVVRTMTATCGYAEVRSLAAQRLEMWIQNPKVSTGMHVNRLHYRAQRAQMPVIVTTDVLYVVLCVCLLDITMSCDKLLPIEMPLWIMDSGGPK